MHSADVFDPVDVLNVPDWQLVHNVPSPLNVPNVPAGHKVQRVGELEPFMVLKLPALQSVHCSELLEPSRVLKDPG